MKPASPGFFLLPLRLVPWFVLVLGFGLTYLLQDNARDAAEQTRRAEFDFRVKEILDTLQQRLQRYEQVLEGTVGLFAASRAVSRSEFATYVHGLRLGYKYPGIQGVGFSAWVPAGDKARHEASIRAEGFPGYAIHPSGERAAYSSIVYLEPFDWRNRRAFGYDMYSEPVRQVAMARARDQNMASISGKVQLVQETDQDVQAGFLMYLPVYRERIAPHTQEARRASLVGWVYAPFRMRDLMSGVLGQHFGEVENALDLEIYDGEGMAANRLLFDSNDTVHPSSDAYSASHTITHFGHAWTISIHALPAFDAHLSTREADVIAVTGAIVSLLLAVVARLLATTQLRAVGIAEHMTVELRQRETDLSRLNRALRLLSDCNMALVHADDEYRLLNEICRLCVDRGGYLLAWVGYAEHDAARSVRPIAQYGFETGYLDGIDITWSDSERGQGPTGTAIRTGITSVNQNVLTNPGMKPWREAAIRRGYQSSIALPLNSEGGVLGALCIYAAEPSAFNAEEVQLLEELANDLAYGILTLRTRAAHEAAKERVAFLASFDPLTHLPNRVLLHDRLEQAMLAAAKDNSLVAVLYLDIDNFKQINDSLGHEVGDRLLVAAVERLWQCIPATDTICRLSGDEFVILLSGIRDSAAAASVAHAIRDAFDEPLTVDNHSLNTSFSIGISLFPVDGRDFDTLLKHADTAVRNAKEGGRNTYRFFTRRMNADILEQMRLTGRLLPALRNGEFLLHYQPQVHIGSGCIIGVEALVRWQHPEDGLVPPARFIPLAEQSGHIVQIGEWVLHEACRQAQAWQAAGLGAVVVAVNLSAIQFQRSHVADLVAAALARSGLAPQYLELELTESILLQDVAATMRTLHQLKALGIKLSIDDFGTGYSSLSYLKQLAVDKLKIDQSFIRDMLVDADGASIVKAILQLGHSLQLDVIAEGVETPEQLAFLREAGCDEVQGYLFSRPLPADQLARLLDQGLS